MQFEIGPAGSQDLLLLADELGCPRSYPSCSPRTRTKAKPTLVRKDAIKKDEA